MNRTYALVWNHALRAWSVAHEHARRRGKGAGAVLAAALSLPLTAFAADLPTGGQVVAGQGQIGTPSANQMVIDQASNKLAIDWQSFDIAAGNKVTFNQPGSDSIALNRVLGADGSKIMGQLDANGRVFLINPNGVLFGAGAQVNVSGLVASTLDISNSDFAAGNYRFKGDGSNASVINNGQITAADGGSIALLGGTVSNNGVIVANQGSVAMAAGNAVTLDFAGDGLLNVQVDEAVVDALVENHQLIKADGGQVLLTANAGEALLKTVVNNTGVIEAQTLGEKDGKIVLLGDFDGGTVQVAGTLDASAPNGGNGGFIETSGAHVKVADSAKVTTKAQSGKTGTWLIDPNDFTVAASGGDMTGAAVSAAVQSNNFEIQTTNQGTPGGNGDIHVNDVITWSSANTLTLNAERNININAAITASDAGGKVALKYGQSSTDGGTADYHIKAPINLQSGDNFSTLKGSTGSVITYNVVNDAAALQAMKDNPIGNYALGSDIDLSSIANWEPVGSNASRFTGQLAGLGHTLSNLTITRNSTNYVGLFGYTGSSSVIRDIGLVGGSVTGRIFVGGLAGYNSGTISNAYATGNVTGSNNVGGLIGTNYGTISNAYATGTVSGSNIVGGLIGYNSGTISNAYATGAVTGNDMVGGLVGQNNSGTISNAYATGTVTGSNFYVGGLIGYNSSGNISSAYATGTVTGSNLYVGGLVGVNDYGTISNAYATGNVTSTSDYVGGLLGFNSGTISNAYATGAVTGNDLVGGLLGQNYSGTISNTYATGTVSGNYYVGGLFGQNSSGTISNTYAAGTVSGNYYVGGLLGYNYGNISNAYATGTVTGSNLYVGGLVGLSDGGTISNAYATGNVTSTSEYVGGLIGINSGTIINAYATGTVSGYNYVGGLVAYNDSVYGTISNAYATGSVTGNGGVGGLVAYNDSGTISNTYATGTVSGSNSVGGLVAYSSGTISKSFYATTDADGNAINNGGGTSDVFTGNSNGSAKTLTALSDPTTYAGWDSSIWTLPGVDVSKPGYSFALPFLTAVTRKGDIVRRLTPASPSSTSAIDQITNNPSYLAALTYNKQTVPTEGQQQAQESSALAPDMLVTNPLDERLNLQVINTGIRLPEGI